jgi:hypothetical protein
MRSPRVSFPTRASTSHICHSAQKRTQSVVCIHTFKPARQASHSGRVSTLTHVQTQASPHRHPLTVLKPPAHKHATQPRQMRTGFHQSRCARRHAHAREDGHARARSCPALRMRMHAGKPCRKGIPRTPTLPQTNLNSAQGKHNN